MHPGLQHTYWRGIHIGHPASWELAVSSTLDAPGRCTFADRYYQRLDVQWRPLESRPRIDLLLSRNQKREKGQKIEIRKLADLPEPWHGLLRQTDHGQVVHALRYFDNPRTLVEVTLIWPQGREKASESAILKSIEMQDPKEPVRRWRAMGLDVVVPRELDLLTCKADVGCLRWDFGSNPRRPGELVIERLAMVDVWLDEPLEDWLASRLSDAKVVRHVPTRFNGHPAVEIFSRGWGGALALFRGRWRFGHSVAWRCDSENRLYRLHVERVQRSDEVESPSGLKIACCQPQPLVAEASVA
jgi:hypothetical protein